MMAFLTLSRRATACAALLALGGCVYPHVFTTQPDVAFQVRDAAGAPVPGARVVLSAIAYPPPARLHGRSETLTDASGHAAFESSTGFEWAFLVIHGSTSISWRWCVEAPSMATRTGGFWDGVPNRPVPVALAPGAGEACTGPGSLDDTLALPGR